MWWKLQMKTFDIFTGRLLLEAESGEQQVCVECGVCSAGSQTWAGPCRGQSEVDNVTEQTWLRPGQATQHVWQVILRLVTTHHVSRVIVMDNTITHAGIPATSCQRVVKKIKGSEVFTGRVYLVSVCCGFVRNCMYMWTQWTQDWGNLSLIMESPSEYQLLTGCVTVGGVSAPLIWSMLTAFLKQKPISLNTKVCQRNRFLLYFG